MFEAPTALNTVFKYVACHAPQGTYDASSTPWAKYSEEWYWQQLVDTTPFRSIYEDEPGSRQPLIYGRSRNLSQTPREQCELRGVVKGGQHLEGPGQEVELQGLQARPELNGKRGRVLPTSGPGAPTSRPSAGRLAVRLAGSGNELAVRPENLRSPHTPTTAAAAAATAATAAAGGGTGGAASSEGSSAAAGRRPAAAPQQQQQSARRARLAELLEIEFEKWTTAPCLTPAHLCEAGMPAVLIKCSSCGADGQRVERYVALKRSAALSAQPLAASAVQLQCLGCFTAAADAAGTALTEKGIEVFVARNMMGGVEACMMLMGTPKMHWGGVHGSGAMY